MNSIKEYLYEIKSNLSKEDIQMGFNDFDDFVITAVDNYILSLIKNKRKYQEHVIAPIPVSDYHADLPKYAEIIQVAGSDNREMVIRKSNGLVLDTEVAAVMKRDHQDNVYVVHKKKGPCADGCDTELIMNANRFVDELAKGTEYNLIKKTYFDYSEDDHGYCRSGLNRHYYLMRPTESAWHGLGGSFIPECLNFQVANKKLKYDFSIIPAIGKKGKRIKTNFKEGIILLSYYGRIYDEEGFMMVPDEMPNVLEALKYFAEFKIFRKLANTFKTSDYIERERSANQYFMLYNSEAVRELNSYSYYELSAIIARAKYHNNVPKTYEHIWNRDSPDEFQEDINRLHDY